MINDNFLQFSMKAYFVGTISLRMASARRF